jgi:hypothetical protein
MLDDVDCFLSLLEKVKMSLLKQWRDVCSQGPTPQLSQQRHSCIRRKRSSSEGGLLCRPAYHSPTLLHQKRYVIEEDSTGKKTVQGRRTKIAQEEDSTGKKTVQGRTKVAQGRR